jgi:hypothetical protein
VSSATTAEHKEVHDGVTASSGADTKNSKGPKEAEEQPSSSMDSSQDEEDSDADDEESLDDELLEALGGVMVTQGGLGCLALLAASFLQIDLAEQIRWVQLQKWLSAVEGDSSL